MSPDSQGLQQDGTGLEGCGTCRANRGELPTPGGVIYQDGLWRVEHVVEPIPMVGWLVLKPLRHVEAFADLTPDEAASFGPLVRRITTAMTEVLAAAKVYVCLFAEAAGFAHVHVHLIPRLEDTPSDRRGPQVFEYLREAAAEGRNLGDIADAERAASAVRARMIDAR
jgi:diadenosine tetraphosphate (Ap4A) HIT family hydrolase